MNDLPVKGSPEVVFHVLMEKILDFVNNKDIKEFCIGRTNDISAAKSRHCCGDIFALYETENPNDAVETEKHLVKIFLNHNKCNHEDCRSEGGTCGDNVNCVYLAVWRKETNETAGTKAV